MTYIGTLVVIIAVFMAWRGYCRYLCDELKDTRAFLRAVEDYRESMRCYLCTPADWARKYSDDRLAASGFLKKVADGADLLTTYRESRGSYCLSDKTDESLESCFCDFGGGDLTAELANLDTALAKIKSEEQSLTDGFGNRKKVAGALLGACAVGIVILVI